jgi:hypothetical protein
MLLQQGGIKRAEKIKKFLIDKNDFQFSLVEKQKRDRKSFQ